MTLRIGLIAEGDAETRDCWSGSAQQFVQALRQRGVEVQVLDAELDGLTRIVAAATTVSRPRARWRMRYLLSGTSFSLRSRKASALVAGCGEVDAIIQIGATFRVAKADRPLVIYSDGSARFAQRGGKFASISMLSAREIDSVSRREATVYAAADRIWCMSDALRRSFAEDFEVPYDRMRTIYAGANVPPAAVPSAGHRKPQVLFVGKMHERKGSEILLRAFEIVHREMPEAQLHIVGSRPPGSDAPGITAHGFVPSDTAHGRALIQSLFQESAVFCLPSRFEPFGVAFVEAMMNGLPCIGIDRWAMPEIIDDGVTGFIVPDGNVEQLASAMLRILRDRELSQRMGISGRERAERLFTWDKVAERALADLGSLLSGATA